MVQRGQASDMGIYLNPGIENFRRTLAGEIYVDKTMMLSAINGLIDRGENYVCMSRPRRFGKTIAGNMLSTYYAKGCDSRSLFEPLKIAGDPSFESKLNKYNVIKIDMNSEYQNTMDKDKLLYRLIVKIKDEMMDSYPDVMIAEDDSLAEAILKVYSATGEQFVIIIDEYDVLVREQVDEGLFNQYLSFLNGLFKSDTLRPAIALAYLTGILPVVRDKVQSKLNNFREYTILDAGKLAEYVGFTSDEVKSLCEEHGVDYEECRLWYDGYHQRGYEIYNPESVVQAILDGRFSNYWGKTSSYRVISDRIEQNFAGTRDDVIRMVSGECVDVNVTRYMNTMDSFDTKSDLFTYLIHVGYLAYDLDEGTCRIPNKEIRQEWFNAIETEPGYEVTTQIIQSSKELLGSTISGDEEAVAKALDVSHIHVSSNRSYNNEDVLQSAIYLAYIYALNEYTVVKEMTAGKGYADVVYIPFRLGKPAMIIELKHDKTAESAIEQIRKKEYFRSLDNYTGDILFVGINYDEKEKTHTCSIERFTR